MGKSRFLFISMCILAICIPSCTSQVDNQGEELGAKISEGSRSAIQISEERQQVIEVAKHIKFDTDTFYLDITLEEAKKQGLAEEIYNNWVERLKANTQEARSIISKGGSFIFINTLIQSENNISSFNDNIYDDDDMLCGALYYPDETICKIVIPEPGAAQYYKGLSCICTGEVYNTIDETIVTEPLIEHRIWLDGYRSFPGMAEEHVYASISVLGRPTSDWCDIQFPGDLGKGAKPHTLEYAPTLAYGFKGDVLTEATCYYGATGY